MAGDAVMEKDSQNVPFFLPQNRLHCSQQIQGDPEWKT